MKILLTVCLLVITLIPNAQTPDKLELLDIFNLEYVSSPEVSPDGNQIIYVRNFKDIMTDRNLSNLWIINSDGSNNRPLTTGNQNDFAPKWSNKGDKIVYKSNKDGSTQLYMRWLKEGTESKLTNTPQSPGSVSWSYDDKYLAFNMFVPATPSSSVPMPPAPAGAQWNDPPIYIDKMNYRADGAGYLKPGNRQLFVLSADGGTPRQLTDASSNHSSPIWLQDNVTLVFSANLGEEAEFNPLESDIYSLNVNTGDLNRLTDRTGPDGSPQLSPDGKTIAYLGFDDQLLGYQRSKLYTMAIDGKTKRLISTNFDRDIESIQYGKEGELIYFQYTSSGDTKIASMSLAGKVTDLATGAGGLSLGRPYNSADFSVGGGGIMAFTYGDHALPADLGIFRKGVRQATQVNEDLFSYKKLEPLEEINVASSFDGKNIQGWIVKPPDFDPTKKYPLILEIHGGPFASYGSVWSAELQLFAAAGYVVLYMNPRGSDGYGEEFGNLIHHNYPSEDYDDLMTGVDAMIEKGYIDEDQLFVTGGSGGGVLTAWIVGKTDRFKAAVVAKPVINWTSFVLYADGPGFFYKYWFPNKPWDNPEPYFKRSPLSYVGNVKTPTMLLTGEADYRTPIAESEQFYAALKIQKVESAMVRIPGASHGIAAKPSNLIAKVAAILSWFEKYR